MNSRSDINKVKDLDAIRIKRGYKPGWTYHQAKNKGLLNAYKQFKAGNSDSFRPKKQLTIELVPSTCWFSNVRSVATEEEWDRVRKATYAKAGYRCEVCNGQGPKWPVECHEIWDFNDSEKHQKLTGLIALCPSCHEVKHMGYANTQGRGDIAARHLAKVNGWDSTQANTYICERFEEWESRSQFDWTLDISLLKRFGINYETHERKEAIRINNVIDMDTQKPLAFDKVEPGPVTPSHCSNENRFSHRIAGVGEKLVSLFKYLIKHIIEKLRGSK